MLSNRKLSVNAAACTPDPRRATFGLPSSSRHDRRSRRWARRAQGKAGSRLKPLGGLEVAVALAVLAGGLTAAKSRANVFCRPISRYPDTQDLGSSRSSASPTGVVGDGGVDGGEAATEY